MLGINMWSGKVKSILIFLTLGVLVGCATAYITIVEECTKGPVCIAGCENEPVIEDWTEKVTCTVRIDHQDSDGKWERTKYSEAKRYPHLEDSNEHPFNSWSTTGRSRTFWLRDD